MSAEIKDLFGMRTNIITALKGMKITTVAQFAAASDTRAERANLSTTLKLDKSLLYYWAKEVDLLKCDGMTIEDAEILLSVGIRCSSDLKRASAEKLIEFLSVNEYYPKLSRTALTARVLDLITSATRVVSIFEVERGDDPVADVFLSQPTNSNSPAASGSAAPGPASVDSAHNAGTALGFGTQATGLQSGYGAELCDIVSNLGAGIAEAQLQMDQRSLAMHHQVVNDPTCSQYGISETWFAIPEVDFSLKMEYSFQTENVVTSSFDANGQLVTKIQRQKVFRVVPKNATYSNTYSTSGTEESTLHLRFVPVPAPERLTMMNQTDEELLSPNNPDEPIYHTPAPPNNADFTHEPNNSDLNVGRLPDDIRDKFPPADSSGEDASADTTEPPDSIARYVVIVTECPQDKTNAVAKLMAKYMGISNTKARDKVRALPMEICRTAGAASAAEICDELTAAGATCEYREVE